jgi:hypothetical protein
MRENFVSPANFILPIFVHEEGDKNVPIASMPGVYRLAYGNNVVSAVAEARAYGVNQVVIFPKVRERAGARQRLAASPGRGMHACVCQPPAPLPAPGAAAAHCRRLLPPAAADPRQPEDPDC